MTMEVPKELKPLPLNGQAPSHDPAIVRCALELVESEGGVWRAYNVMREQLKAKGLKGPAFSTIWEWVNNREDVISRIEAHEKRKMVNISSEVAVFAAERMLTALPGLSDGQVPVAYGIAMQRRTDWESAGQRGNQLNVQFNLKTRD